MIVFNVCSVMEYFTDLAFVSFSFYLVSENLWLNDNNNKRQSVRRRNMSVDITRAPYRQSGNVVVIVIKCIY